MKHKWLILVFLGLLSSSCAYRPYVGILEPLSEAEQGESMSVADDGTVTYTQGRLELRLRPMSDEELNRQFQAYSQDGAHSVNPYTFGNSQYFKTRETPKRFTVFKLTIKNYEFPKVRLNGEITVESDNGRKYYALTFSQLDRYFRSYAIGYRGNDYSQYDERRDLLRRTMFPQEDIFSGQEQEGYVLFAPLADDVEAISVKLPDVVTRFDFRGEPAESIEAHYRFRRDIGRIYPGATGWEDGRIELTSK
ncbi:MAG: hypothetical protein GKR89_21280 [Candidatus Latescibacteria bacterium]|nr:hypothetical protein [Candidatus Latescibacterota bacterium]